MLREALPPETAVVFGRAAGRADERIAVVPLAEADVRLADMATCVIVGSAATRTVGRGALPPLVYTPRCGEGGEMSDRAAPRRASAAVGAGGRSTMTTGRPRARAAAILP